MIMATIFEFENAVLQKLKSQELAAEYSNALVKGDKFTNKVKIGK